MLDVIWISIAFVLGLAARQLGLPALVGYLVAGFVLYALDIETGETLRHFSDLGVTLLLFSIGLKLRLGSLLKPYIWGVASLHMAVIVLLYGAAFAGLGALRLSLFTGLDAATAILVAFALSFSSTVFAVKVLEDKGEMSSFYGGIAIGILIIQDIAAVVFLAASTGKIPSPWALLLLALIPLRPLLTKIMERAGHGELLILFGLTLALGGAEVFNWLNVKGDLGALILGVLLSSHHRASDLARALLGFKDLFLVGFFLSIGLTGIPGPEALAIAALLALLIPLKGMLFFWLLSRFRLRARTAFLTSLSLGNYSEFGLIVGTIAVANGWLADTWLLVIAIALAISFILASPLNNASHNLYERYRARLKRFQTHRRIPEEEAIDPGELNILILGMGRVGTGAYDAMRRLTAESVVGVDLDPETVDDQRQAGRNVIRGSAVDPDFWSRLSIDHRHIRLVLLAMPLPQENLLAVRQLRNSGYIGPVAAVAKYADDVQTLKQAGVTMVFNLYAEAGTGFAAHVCEQAPEGVRLIKS
jgi:predicted Kef-type K+ transport protein